MINNHFFLKIPNYLLSNNMYVLTLDIEKVKSKYLSTYVVELTYTFRINPTGHLQFRSEFFIKYEKKYSAILIYILTD